METIYSKRLQDAISYSKEEAIRLGNKYISPEHLFLGLLREGSGSVIQYLEELDVNLKKLKQLIEEKIRNQAINNYNTKSEELSFNHNAKEVLYSILEESKKLKSKYTDTVHLFLALLKNKSNLISKVLKRIDIDYKSVMQSFTLLQPKAEIFPSSEEKLPSHKQSKGTKEKGSSKSNTPVLDSFGFDITQAAKDDILDPIIGRKVEIERISQILSRRKKNNPILIGEPGVGKSAIVEGLALRIIQKKVSRILFDKRIVLLDLASIVAGTKYRGQFEERMKSILNEIINNKNIILFIDEVHTIIGTGGASGSLDAANMLKPALARGEIQCVGATTLEEYSQHIEKDGALERRFQKILVVPSTIDETIKILHNIKPRYEDHHNVIYTDDAIKACVLLTDRYITNRFLPDKAIDALDESGSKVHISNIKVPQIIEILEKKIEKINSEKIKAVKAQNFENAAAFRDQEKVLEQKLEIETEKWQKDLKKNKETVTAENVAEVVSMITGVPVKKIAQEEGLRLINMEKELRKFIVGQDEVVTKISKAIRRNRAGLKDPSKPIGSFIFLGSTGVGKTYLAKVLSEYLFNATDALLRIDMSEYMEKFSVSRLIGAPPGYIGYEKGGQLTEKVRQKPYVVILLDEIEKAHPDVFNILLQILDDGQLTDGLGRKVDFKNTIIILTSNIGNQKIKDFGRGIGFETPNRKTENNFIKNVIQKAVKNTFSPEFLNRIDETIIFNQLNKKHLEKIFELELKELYQRMADLGHKLNIDNKVKEFIIEKGFDPNNGVRPLKRTIQNYIENELAEVLVNTTTDDGATIYLAMNKDNSKINIKIEASKTKA